MLSLKKIFFFGLFIFLLIAIPVSVYFFSQQLKSETNSVPSSSLNLTPNTQKAGVGKNLSFDININPYSNSINIIKIIILYDATKLSLKDTGFIPNASSFLSISEGPTLNPGSISISFNANPGITIPTKIGTLTFKTLDATNTSPTQIFFGDQTKVLSNNQPNENLLATAVPANINIFNYQQFDSTPSSKIISPTPTLITKNNNIQTKITNSLYPETNVNISASPTSFYISVTPIMSPTAATMKPILPPTGPSNIITIGIIGIIFALTGVVILLTL